MEGGRSFGGGGGSSVFARTDSATGTKTGTIKTSKTRKTSTSTRGIPASAVFTFELEGSTRFVVATASGSGSSSTLSTTFASPATETADGDRDRNTARYTRDRDGSFKDDEEYRGEPFRYRDYNNDSDNENESDVYTELDNLLPALNLDLDLERGLTPTAQNTPQNPQDTTTSSLSTQERQERRARRQERGELRELRGLREGREQRILKGEGRRIARSLCGALLVYWALFGSWYLSLLVGDKWAGVDSTAVGTSGVAGVAGGTGATEGSGSIVGAGEGGFGTAGSASGVYHDYSSEHDRDDYHYKPESERSILEQQSPNLGLLPPRPLPHQGDQPGAPSHQQQHEDEYQHHQEDDPDRETVQGKEEDKVTMTNTNGIPLPHTFSFADSNKDDFPVVKLPQGTYVGRRLNLEDDLFSAEGGARFWGDATVAERQAGLENARGAEIEKVNVKAETKAGAGVGAGARGEDGEEDGEKEEGERKPWSMHAWKGIPYAQTTTGKNRFRPPKKLVNPQAFGAGEEVVPECEDREGGGRERGGCTREGTKRGGGGEERVYSAWSLGPRCCNWVADDVAEGEDCLNLDVFVAYGRNSKPPNADNNTQGNAPKKLKPVVVYIHGGAFNNGKGAERDMASFVSFSEVPIIGISFNYRVGALGFLPSEFMAKRGLLNLGLRDQIAALEWVRENVGEFGGDSGRVTIMGLSAGAHSIGHHLSYHTLPTAPSPPFHRAILESGTSLARATYSYNHPRHETQFRDFLNVAGLSPNLPESELMAALREGGEETGRRLARASRIVWDRYSGGLRWPFQPAVEPTPEELVEMGVTEGGMEREQRWGMGTQGWERTPEKPWKNGRRGDDEGDTTYYSLLEDPIIPERPIDLMASSQRLRIPILAGFQDNEGAVFVARDVGMVEYFGVLVPAMGEGDMVGLRGVYPLGDGDEDDTGSASRGAGGTTEDAAGDSKQMEVIHRKYAHPSQQAIKAHGLGPEWPRLEAAYAHYAYICPVLLTGHYFASSVWTTSLASAHPDSSVQDNGEEAREVALVPPPVFLYRFSATRADLNTSNHGDEGPFVWREQKFINQTGLRGIADKMNLYWTRFVAGEEGDVNEVVGNGDGGVVPKWPRFVSPFGGGDLAGTYEIGTRESGGEENGGKETGKGGQGEAEEEIRKGKGKGEIMVFGLGNDIRAGGTNVGVDAYAGRLEGWDLMQCRYWFKRVGLSEGMGER